MYLSVYKKDELYTIVSPIHSILFNKILDILGKDGGYVEEIKEESEKHFVNNIDFVFYYNGKVWKISDTPPSDKRFCLIQDYFGNFLCWKEDERLEDLKEIMNMMVENIFEKYNLVKPSFYLRINDGESLMTVIHNESFEQMTVLEYNNMKNEMITEGEKLLNLFKVRSIELYCYMDKKSDIVIKSL